MSQTDDISDSIVAARYALGVAELAEIVESKARMETDPAFAARVAFYEAALYALEPGVEAIELPEDSWDRIAAAIFGDGKHPPKSSDSVDAMAWKPFIPGVSRKIVSASTAGTSQVALYRVEPGAVVSGQLHCLTDECLVLEGGLEIGGVALPPEDVHLAFDSSRHDPLTSRNGALLYVRADLQTRM